MEVKGATIWMRQTIDSDVFYWKPDKWFKIWFFIINRVNFKDTKQFKRGSAYIEYKEICLKTKASYKQVEKFIKWGKQEGMLEVEKSTRGNIIFVLNYAKYQDTVKNKKETLGEALGEAKGKQKGSKRDAIGEECNNDNNDNNTILPDKSGDNEVNKLLSIFLEINPAINFGNKTERKDLEWFLSKYGYEKVEATIRYAISIQSKKYAPVITTPHQLKNNFSKLIIFKNKEDNQDNKITVI